MNIQGSVIMITGASSGIGAATARAAFAAGARLVLLARREDRITELAEELGNALAVRCDVTDRDQAEDTYGRVDVLVNNAGQGLEAAIEDIAIEDFRDILDLNLVAPLIMMQAVLPLMRAQGAGAIINVSSGVTFYPRPHSVAYNSAKAGLNMLSAVARAELADQGIAVSTMLPFVTATEFTDALKAGSEAARAEPAAAVAHTPERVADRILDLIRSGDERADLVPQRFGGSLAA
ncbi:SDR family oxidoreductase [Martelella mediterranea]|uniref:Putative oxidoreductase n=1 Tax=Martelella mediterranea DSM 17316 TaxID=1122214 RepID=A0A1U9Z9T3_9HYPH|nr:SDR family NAD(P)-dependent oxidoreductase [Martelella mediterranea]AQZ54461.1 putative oxidoreductase [Martelella mediterranea DSM 17316]